MNPLFQPLIDEVNRTKGVTASAVALLNGFPAVLQAKIAEALAGGATGQEISAVVNTVLAELSTSTNDLAAAVASSP